MSDADDEPVEEAADASVESFESRLDGAAEAIEAAGTEADLDDVEATLDGIAEDLDGADLPEPEDDEEADPAAALADRLEELREDLEEARGPYASDVVDAVTAAAESIREGDWTEAGEEELVEPVDSFLSAAADEIEGVPATTDRTATEALAGGLDAAGAAIDEAGLDPDDDAATIGTLLEAASALEAGVEAAEEWDDLTVREQLQAHGFYDVLDHHKDYPPEWSALKEHEQRGDAEMVVLALELMDSNFMEDHCFEALRRMMDPVAMDAMLERAERRDQAAIEVLGKIGEEEPLEMLLEYAADDDNPGLQLVTLRAIGEIGSEEATQVVADRLVHDDDRVRSEAARALGLIGDPRAIDPLADVLDGDEAQAVRGSAAWALNRIGTERALAALEPYEDDRVYLVQVEAERARAT